MNEERITYLFYRYFDGTSTPDEKVELADLIQNPLYKERFLALMEEAWKTYSDDNPVFSEEKSRKLLTEVLGHPITDESELTENPHRPVFLWKRFAAVAMIIIATGLAFYFYQDQKRIPEAMTVIEEDILPGRNIASLTLQDGTVFHLETAENGLLTRQEKVAVMKVNDGQIVYQAPDQSFNGQPAFHELITPRGGQYMLILPDGSKAWLNAASSIRFPVPFSESDRKVEITGEVFFEITKSKRKNGQPRPFFVKVHQTEIEVLGTQFNINAYDDEHMLRTTLLEGSVKVHNGNLEKLLKPGQEASISQASSSIQINEVDTEMSVAWKNGYFQFEQTPLQEVMRQLSKWYDVDVSYEGAIPDRAFSGEISRSTTLSQVLEILEISKVHFNRDDKKILIKP